MVSAGRCQRTKARKGETDAEGWILSLRRAALARNASAPTILGQSVKTIAQVAGAGSFPSVPVSAPALRILSDFHYTDPASWVERLDEVKPLLDGVGRVVMNGDTLDTQVRDNPQEIVGEVKRFFAQHSADTCFLAGNHDPDISASDELSLGGGLIWVTHGHVFFDDIAPWSRLVPEIRRRIRTQAAAFPMADIQQLETRFRLYRQICLKLPREHDPNQRGTWAKLQRAFYALFPPHQTLGMLRAWRSFPEIVFRVAKEQRATARVIITGHTHHPGVWRAPDGRILINTGSFTPPRGGRLVDVMSDRLIIRRIVRRGGEFRPGSTVTEIALAPTGTSSLSASP